MTNGTRKIISWAIPLMLFLLVCCSGAIGINTYIDWEEQLQLEALIAPLAESLDEKFPLEQAPTTSDWRAFLIIPRLVLLPVLVLPFQLVFIATIFFIAFVIHRLAWRIAGWFLDSRMWYLAFSWSSHQLKASHLHIEVPHLQMTKERHQTIQRLIASTISIVVFSTAIMLSLAQFMNSGALAVVTGLFTAAFGFGARTLIGDLLAGVSNIFEDNFDVDEKVEIAHVTGKVEGIVEDVNLRTVSIRAPSGELYIIPNGEIRVLRNFSRGRFSTAHIKLNIATCDLKKVLPLLQTLGKETVDVLPSLLEPWQIISEQGVIGEHTQLTLLVKARFGRAAQMRPGLLALIQERLNKAGISLVD